jgi:ubiquinone/menaquinone biosynthesis C-methylase UbiE
MFSIILRPLTDLVRHILSKPDERGNLTSDLFRFKIRAKTRQLINDHDGVLLDIGCGDGLLYENIMTKQNNLKYIGIDTEREMLKIAKKSFQKKKQNRLNFLKAYAQSLPFLDKTIDIAICINTFYNFHTKDDVVDTLEEMERVCKRDGFIIFDVRNKINPFVYLSFKFVWIYDTHVTLNAYSLKELTTVLTSKGLVIKKTIPIGFPITMFAPIILVKVGYQ